MKRVQDPVHGLMEFHGMEEFVIELLQAREIQRMRRIRQLGLASLVYPGADHSRFAHSLGAAYITSRFAAALRVASQHFLAEDLQADEEIGRDLVVAAICHDVGHGPLSHVWERHVVGTYSSREWRQSLGVPPKPWINDKMKWHELVTQAFLLNENSDLHQRLEQLETGAAERVAGLIAGDYFLPYLARLFDSDVDVDRCDFVIRDAHHTGVGYGRFDLQWLVSTITVGVDQHGSPVVGFDRAKAPRAIEQLLIARRALYNTVYFHRGVRGAERMMGRLMELLATSDAGDLERLARRPRRWAAFERAVRRLPMTFEQVRSLDDFALDVFVTELADSAKDPIIRDLAGRLAVRQLFKPLPLADRKLDEFLFDGDRSLAAINAGLIEAGYEHPDAYRVSDTQDLSFFEASPERTAYFVDQSDSARLATPISEHPELAHYRSDVQPYHWMFVPADAIRPVMRAIERSRRPSARTTHPV